VDPVEFVTWDELLEFHQIQLQRYGGQDGFVSEGVLRSVLSRPQFTFQYVPDATIADLAADYLFGFATTQGFMDGNKRTALAAANLFVRKNGFRFSLSEDRMYEVTMEVANGRLDRDAVATILFANLVPLDD